MSKLLNLISLFLLILTIVFNLYLNYPETQILADPNDNIFQFSLLNRTDWVWRNYGCPFSLSCLPNLTDHLVPNWAEGYSLPFYYTHVPQIATVASYHLLIKPVVSIFNYQFTIFNYYNWTKYLLYTLFPIPVFIALRLVGFNPLLSAIGAFFASHYSTDGLYGIDPVSYLWRGYGLTSQLYGIFFLPLALAFTYRALKEISNIKYQISKIQIKNQKYENTLDIDAGDASSGSPNSRRSEYLERARSGAGERQDPHIKIKNNAFWAIIFLTLTTAGHLGVGIIGLLSTLPFLFFDFKLEHIINRIKKLAFIGVFVIFLLSYWIIPILLNNNYHIISFWDPIWKFDSYGWYEVVKQYLSGEIFDWQRAPIITVLATIGFFVLLANSRLFPFALLFAFWILMYFGRTTWGGLIDLIPAMKDFHQHRFVVGVQIASLFLLPAGLEYIFGILKTSISIISSKLKTQIAKPQLKTQNLESLKTPRGWQAERSETMTPPTVEESIIQNIIFYILILAFISTLVYFTAKKTWDYAQLNIKWIYEANKAYLYDEKNFQDLLTRLDILPNARIYAGRPGNWGKNFRLGSTQMYMLIGSLNYDLSQFLPETWSPLSENEQNFDERVAEDYNLLNIRYIAAPKNQGFTPDAKLDKKFGPFELYLVPTSGWFDIVTSPMFVQSDKTNYINIVHLWHTSYARRWKMHPLISVEKKPVIPADMQKVIEMKDEVSYIEGDKDTSGVLRSDSPDGGGIKKKNIFADFPFVFPQATPSGKITAEKVERQTYTGTVEVPDNCRNCFVMFKMSYHPNWSVKLDGNSIEKYAVFPFYLAVPAGPGSHTVEFTYQPNRLKTILIAGEIIVGLVFLLRKKIKLS